MWGKTRQYILRPRPPYPPTSLRTKCHLATARKGRLGIRHPKGCSLRHGGLDMAVFGFLLPIIVHHAHFFHDTFLVEIICVILCTRLGRTRTGTQETLSEYSGLLPRANTRALSTTCASRQLRFFNTVPCANRHRGAGQQPPFYTPS